MSQFIIRRLLKALVVLFGVTFFSFGMLFLTGDPALLMANEQWTEADLEEFRHQMGFDRPWIVQYADFIGRAVQGDFGTSLRHRQPALKLVLERMPATLELTFAAMILSIVMAFPVGIISAVKRHSIYDHISMLAALLGQSMPVFWLGIMLILVFGVWLRWLPVSGRGDWQNLVMPAVALAMYPVARNARMVRSSLLNVLAQEYVITARAKGLTEFYVIFKHALKNAAIPMVTVVALDLPVLFGGSLFVEIIFSWPGMGRLYFSAVEHRDYPILMGSILIIAVMVILANLLADIIYAYLDPRIRYEA